MSAKGPSRATLGNIVVSWFFLHTFHSQVRNCAKTRGIYATMFLCPMLYLEALEHRRQGCLFVLLCMMFRSEPTQIFYCACSPDLGQFFSAQCWHTKVFDVQCSTFTCPMFRTPVCSQYLRAFVEPLVRAPLLYSFSASGDPSFQWASNFRHRKTWPSIKTRGDNFVFLHVHSSATRNGDFAGDPVLALLCAVKLFSRPLHPSFR